MWIRFSDDKGSHIGDREMPEAPSVGDSINLRVVIPIPQGGDGIFDRYFRVGRRQWLPDCALYDGKKIAVLILLERT
jgi:hypothetical protein